MHKQRIATIDFTGLCVVMRHDLCNGLLAKLSSQV